MKLLPQAFLLIIELLLRLIPHLFHKPLLPYYLILFNLPESPLFLNLYHLQFLIQLLFPQPLLESRPFGHLLHLACLLSHGLPDQLALEPLLVVLTAPLLLEDAVPVRLLPLPRLHVRLQLPQRVIRLLLLQQLQELLVRFELHVRDVLVLQAGFEVVLGLTRFLDEFFLCYPSLFPLEIFLPQQRLLNALLNLLNVFKLRQPRDLLQPYPLLEHLLLLHLHLPLPLELSRPCSLLLSADALLIRQHLLRFQPQFF